MWSWIMTSLVYGNNMKSTDDVLNVLSEYINSNSNKEKKSA